MMSYRAFIKAIIYKRYLSLFGKRQMQRFNNIVFDLAIRAKGCENSENMRVSGEQYFLRNIMRSGTTLCLDIGANRGNYSRFILDNSQSKVIAFEPHPDSYRHLQKLKEIYPRRFECFDVGVGDRNQVAQLNQSTDNTELSSFCDDISQIPYVKEINTSKIEVQMVTLDSLIDSIRKYGEKIDLLKIDTEGYEYEVILGATKVINDFAPTYIQLEFNWHHLFRGHSLRQISKLLPNYEAFILLPYNGGQMQLNLDQGESNLYFFQNIVFQRKNDGSKK